MDKRLTNRHGETEESFLAAYDPGTYDRPSVTVDIVIFSVDDAEASNYRKLPEKTLSLLLIRRGDHPFLGQWALPGGFVNIDEDLDTAVRRELKEETGIGNIYMEQLYTWGDVDRDPRTRVISCSYLSLVDSSLLEVQANDDADDARWFRLTCRVFREERSVTEAGTQHCQWHRLHMVNDGVTLSAVVKVTRAIEGKVVRIHREVVESQGIAFDHAMVIQYGLERLRTKIEYTDIVFNLMEDLFTLTELQQVYEVILDKELLKANFRRKISDRVIETNNYRKDAGHRPSKLFRFNPEWTHPTE